jgi:putative serine protease PepD
MSDDIFWPPLSGSGDGDDARQADDGQPGDNPAQSSPTQPQPLAGDAGAGSQAAAYPTAAYPTTAFASDGPMEGFAATDSEASYSDSKGARRVGAAVLVGATAFVFGGIGVAVGAAVVHHNNTSTTVVPISSGTSIAPSALNTSPKSFAAIAARVLPSVVSINVTGSSESDTGSGVILRSDGYILTNNHVVAAAANGGSISVSFNDGSTVAAHTVGTDPLDDLAVLKVTKTGLTAAELGDSAAIEVGDPVLAVGSPLGLTGTVTSGIVSALNRPVETQDESQQQTLPFGGGSTAPSTEPTVIDAIQTDAAINPGNSGGALVNASGQVIGINSAIASLGSSSLGGTQSGNIGVGFAIPINQAKVIANELISTGHATHPLLGVSLEDQTSSTGVARAVVHSVTSGGPADGAGIENNDVITAVNGVPTAGSEAVIAAIRSYQPGQQISVTYERGDTTKTVQVTLTTLSSTQG